MKVKTILKLQVLILHQWKRGKIIKKSSDENASDYVEEEDKRDEE